VIRIRLLLIGVLVVGVFSISVTSAEASPCATWTGAGGDGLWSTATNWSTGTVPGYNGNQPDVCLPDTGHSYTVTFAPSGGNGGITVNTLTVGGAAGSDTVTLDIVGQSYVYQGETRNGDGIGVANGATINATGSVVLDATAGGERALSSDPLGGPAGFGDSPFGGGAAIDNYGQIIAESSDYPTWDEQLNGDVTNEPGAQIMVTSGSLDQQTSNTVTNDGTVTTDVGGDYDVTSGGTNDIFTNNGAVANHGTFEVGGQTGTFTQHGPVTGNAVMIESSAILADQSGAGTFTLEYGSPVLTGTIPVGQTVNVRGASDIYQGETQNGTNLSLDGTTLTNDGTLTLDATADGTRQLASDTLGGGVAVFDGSLTNNGTLDLKVDDPAWTNTLNASVTNSHSGSATVTGVMNQAYGVNGITFTNEGTVTLAPTALWNLYGGATYTNASDGTLIPQIAGVASFGKLSVGGTMTAAGTIAPVLTAGYTPPAGQEFDVIVTGGSNFTGTYTGKFGAVASGFAADYTHETASPPYVGVVYHSSSAPGTVTIGSGAKVSRDDLAGVTLKCSGAKGATCAGTLKLTVRVRTRVSRKVKGHRRRATKLTTVQIGSAAYKVPAGKSETLGVKLSAVGVRLLDAAGKRGLAAKASAIARTGSIGTVARTMTLTPPPRRHRTKKLDRAIGSR
jgi:hypothetical protein